MHDLLDWTEKAAQENLKFHLQNADSLAKEANTTLTVLLAALGGVLAYALKLLDSGLISATLVSVAVLTLYLTALCSLLVFKCMKIAPIPAPTNEPKNLYQKDFALDRLREVVRLRRDLISPPRLWLWDHGLLCKSELHK